MNTVTTNKSKLAMTTSLLATGVLFAISVQATDLSSYTATYAVKADGRSGTAIRILTKTGNHYNYTVKASAAGIASIHQSSEFRLLGGSVVPLESSMSIRFFGMGNTHNIKFNHTAKTAISTYKGKSVTLKMNSQTYDDLSLEAQIRQELIHGKFTGNYNLVRKTTIENTRFKRFGTSKITVPAGTYDVVRIERIHDDRGRTTNFWLAPSLNYLPIKVSQTNDGKTISMSLTNVTSLST